MVKILSTVVVAAAFLISGMASAMEIDNSGCVEVERISYPEPGESINAAQRIAEVMVRRALVEEIGELRVTSSTTVKQRIDGRELDDTVVAQVDKVIQGSRVEVKRQTDGSFVAVVRLKVFGGNSIANLILPTNSQVEDFPKPKFTNLESGSFGDNYTGLIVDCSGQDISTALAPTIKMLDGTEIYSFKNVQRQIAVNRGLTGYADSTDNGVQRAGNNPLVVKAVFVEECDAVVSDEDADKILAANQSSRFLNNCLVVFVR